MQKKGQSEVLQLSTLFEILVAIIVGAFFVLASLGFNQFTKFDKVYLEKDIEMLVNTMLSSPGSVTFNYTHAKMYNINIKSDEVEVLRDFKIKDIKKKHYLILKKEGPLTNLGGKLHE